MLTLDYEIIAWHVEETEQRPHRSNERAIADSHLDDRLMLNLASQCGRKLPGVPTLGFRTFRNGVWPLTCLMPSGHRRVGGDWDAKLNGHYSQ
jgi:hypothetical protein